MFFLLRGGFIFTKLREVHFDKPSYLETLLYISITHYYLFHNQRKVTIHVILQKTLGVSIQSRKQKYSPCKRHKMAKQQYVI